MKKYHVLETGLDSFRYLLSPFSVAGTVLVLGLLRCAHSRKPKQGVPSIGCDVIQKKNSIREALNLSATRE